METKMTEKMFKSKYLHDLVDNNREVECPNCKDFSKKYCSFVKTVECLKIDHIQTTLDDYRL
jgi:hypothetical protein